MAEEQAQEAPDPTATPAANTPTPEPTSAPSTEEAAADLPTPTTAPAAAETTESSEGEGNPDLDYAQVRFVKATQGSDGLWRFETTVRHNDEGWDHYADAWQVVGPDGEVLAERVLAHPHDNEQPFTRSQSNIEIPSDVNQVTVRAKCNVHGFGGQEVTVDLTASDGENFEVVRP
jgi:hypothetical protein